MALAQILQRRVQAHKDEDGDDHSSHSESVPDEEHQEDSDSDKDDKSIEAFSGDESENTAVGGEDTTSVDATSSANLPQHSITNVSFGALASAHASLSLKRRRTSESVLQSNKRRSLSPFHEAAERLAGKNDHRLHTRTSKHAPTELSSKKAVSRKRSVVPIPTIAHRDPRFEPLSGPLDTIKLEKKYSFLNDYRASEIAALKSNIRNTKDTSTKERLKRELLSMESREKAKATKETQQEVLREHRRKEKEAVAQGKKPFFLKKGEQKKLALVKKFEGMGDKKVERVIERRRKKKAGKERKSMPFGRRLGDGEVAA